MNRNSDCVSSEHGPHSGAPLAGRCIPVQVSLLSTIQRGRMSILENSRILDGGDGAEPGLLVL